MSLSCTHFCLVLDPQFSSVQSLSRVWLFVTPWTAACQASLSITNSRSLLKLMSIELVMPSNHLLGYPLLLLPSVFPSIRVFSNESVKKNYIFLENCSEVQNFVWISMCQMAGWCFGHYSTSDEKTVEKIRKCKFILSYPIPLLLWGKSVKHWE